MYQRITLSFILATGLYGCATPAPPYALSANAPYANLKSAISGADNRNESIQIYLLDTSIAPHQRGKLFSIAKSVSTPAGYVKVAANEPLVIFYEEAASGGRTCQLSLKATLEQGKDYSLVGGFVYESGPIPILTGTRKCQLSIKNDVVNSPAPPR
jgi:hypothetical protein